MRIYFVCRRVPFPPDRGDKIATYHQVRHLARAHEVHVFCLADAPDDDVHAEALRAVCASVTVAPFASFRGKLRAFAALAGQSPLSVAMLGEPELYAAIKRSNLEFRPELWIVYGSNMAQFAEGVADAPRIMQFADLDSRKWHAYAARQAGPMRLVYGLEARRLLAYERRLARTFSHSVVCTETEAREFRTLIPDASVSVVGNGVDLDYFRPGALTERGAALIFTGVMDYPPNVDAVCWFCTEILPLLRQEVPEATLVVCGSRPTRAVRRLARIPRVTVTGRVPDVRPYLRKAALFVAPLRIARGIQNKLLEAMAMGLPVVASRTAWRGSSIPEGEGILTADNPEPFAGHIVRLLRDDSYRAAMGRSARAAVERRSSWPAQLASLDRIVAETASPAGNAERRWVAHTSGGPVLSRATG